MYNSEGKCKARACKQAIHKDGYCKKHHYYYIEKEYDKKVDAMDKICIVDGCSNYQFSLGFCKRHKSQFDKYEEILEITRNDPQRIEVFGDMAHVYFRDRNNNYYNYFIIDIEDINKTKEHIWRMSNTGYATTDTKDETRGHLRYHNFILNRDYKGEKYIIVDHINGDKLDNRKINLRITTRRNNQRNTGIRASNNSGVTGVRWKKNENCYVSEITINGMTRYLGRSKVFDEMVLARISEEAKVFKEYSNNYNQTTNTVQLNYKSLDDNLTTFIEVDLQGNILQFYKNNH